MSERKQKVEELLADLESLKRATVFQMPDLAKIPRVTPSQWGVLSFIEQHGESTVKEVAKTLGITSSATTQLVDGLVTSKYLMRKTHTEDRRTVRLTLSKKSQNQVKKMKGLVLQGFLKLFAVLDDKEFNQYLAINKKIVRGFLFKKSL